MKSSQSFKTESLLTTGPFQAISLYHCNKNRSWKNRASRFRRQWMRFHLHVVLNKTSTPHELFKHVCLLRYRPLLYYQLKHQDQLQYYKHAQETSYQEAHNKPNPLPQQNSNKPKLGTQRIQNILVSLNQHRIPERSKAHPKIHKHSLLKSLPIYKMRLSVNVFKGRISKSSQSVLRNQVEDIYKIEEKSPQQQFEGNKTISAVITIWESV